MSEDKVTYLASEGVDTSIPITDSIPLTTAEQNVTTTQMLVRDIKRSWLQLGMLLKANYDAGYWSVCGFESWKDYIEQLGFDDYSRAMKLISVASLVLSGVITQAEVQEIGMSKSFLLISSGRAGTLTPELIETAKSAPNRDLRILVGQKVTQNNECYSINCPRCGAVVIGAQWVRKHSKEE